MNPYDPSRQAPGMSPGGYPGQGYPGGPMMPMTPLVPGAIPERNSGMVVVLTIVTCGFYSLYWHYKLSEELRAATGDTTINPGMDLVLMLLTCGLWGIYLDYRNAEKVYKLLAPREPGRKDQTQTVILLDVCSLVVGVTWLVASYILQEELNALSRASRNG